MGHYVRLYDVRQTSAVDWLELLPYLVVMVPCVLYLRSGKARQKLFLWLGLAIATTAAAGMVIGGYYWHHILSSRLNSGAYEIVEGPITEFEPGDWNRKPETFVVAGHAYSYKMNERRWGYQTVQGEFGAFRNGVVVRIADVDGAIARLEIRQ